MSAPGRTPTQSRPPLASPTWVVAPEFGASRTKWSLRAERRYDPRALPAGMPRRLALAALAAALLALLVAAPSAFADAVTPESGGSPNAEDIDTLYKITLYIGIVIFLIVEGTLIWSLVKLPRPPRRPGGGADPRQHAARAGLDAWARR